MSSSLLWLLISIALRLSKPTAYTRLHFIVLIYGFTGILGELITLDSVQLVWHRMWIAAAVIFIYLIIRRRLDFNLAQSGWKIILAGGIIALHWITFFYSIKVSTVSVAVSCLATGAFFGSLIEPLFYRKKIDQREVLLGIMVIGGLYLIFRFEGEYTLGIVVGLFSAFLSALFSVINSKLIRSNTPYRISFLEMLGGWLAISVFMIFTGDFNAGLLSISSTDWIYLLILGSVCTAFAFIENVAIMRSISPFSILLAINLEPVYSIILALILFNEGELLSPFFFVGAGLIILTVFVDALLKRRRVRVKM